MTDPQFLPIDSLVLRVVITRSPAGGYVATCSELDAQVTRLNLEDLTVQLQSFALSLFDGASTDESVPQVEPRIRQIIIHDTSGGRRGQA